MKLTKVLSAIAVVGMMATGSVSAQTIADTGHNMTLANLDNATDSCRFCHTPHGAFSQYPLWTRNAAATLAADFTMYTSLTLDVPNQGDLDPGPQSMACLSCHDGVTAFDNVTGRDPVDSNGQTMTTQYAASVSILDTDLSNDHPVGVTVVGVAEMNATPSIAKVYGNLVECASCHDPHEAILPYFLRTDTDLCVDCHVK